MKVLVKETSNVKVLKNLLKKLPIAAAMVLLTASLLLAMPSAILAQEEETAEEAEEPEPEPQPEELEFDLKSQTTVFII